MKKIEQIYREILYSGIEKKQQVLTQQKLSKNLRVSLSTVNHSLKPLKDMGAINIRLKNFTITNTKKILYYWASIRNINKDIIYKTRVLKPISEIEKLMPQDIIFTAYSAYKFLYKDIPSDYSEIYVYSDNIEEIEKRFPLTKGPENLFVLKKDDNLSRITFSQLFVDLWNLKEWYAKEFLIKMEEKLNGILS